MKNITLALLLIWLTAATAFSAPQNHQIADKSDLQKSSGQEASRVVSDIMQSTLAGIQNIEFRAEIDYVFTPAGLAELGKDNSQDYNFTSSLHYAADSAGRYYVDEDSPSDSLTGQGSKSTYDGQDSMFLLKSNGILAVLTGAERSNPFLAMSYNPFLDGLGFLVPDLHSEANVSQIMSFPQIVSSETISERSAALAKDSVVASKERLQFEIPGTGISDGRQFDYAVVLEFPKGFPVKLTRVAKEDKKPIRVSEVTEWKELQVAEGTIWLPAKISSKVFSANGELFMSVNSKIEDYQINQEFSPDFFRIPSSEARSLLNENTEILTDLKDQKQYDLRKLRQAQVQQDLPKAIEQ